MENLSEWTALFFDSFTAFGETIMGTLPNIIGAIMILFLGWLFAKIISSAISKLLKVVKFDALADRVNATDLLEKANIKTTPSKMVAKFAYWLILLLVLITASETLGWNAVSSEISKLLSFLPALFSAILIFTLGVYVATFIRDVIRGTMSSLGLSIGNVIGSAVFYLLLIMVTLTSLNQAGMDTSIITSNLLIILGSLFLGASISYGIASRDVLSNILAAIFSKRIFTVGQKIKIDDVEGKIIGLTNISVIIENETGRVVIPTQELINKKVTILK